MTARVDISPKRNWAMSLLRHFVALSWFLSCYGAEIAFDSAHSGWLIRTDALLVVILPIVWGAFRMRSWLRNADEYQRLLMFRAMFEGMATAIVAAIVSHCLGTIMGIAFNIMPIMCVPAWAAWQALSASHRSIAPPR